MTGQDRTAEFRATIQSKKEKPQWIKQQQQQRLGVETINKLAVDPQYRDFMRISRLCSLRIRDSYEKLEKFTNLAKRRTLADDVELNRLIGEIRADISESKSQLDYLQSAPKPKQKHSENTVHNLKQRLANVTSNFKSSLEMRSRSVQQQAARHELFAGPADTYYNQQAQQQQKLQHPQQQMLLMHDQIEDSTASIMSERAAMMQTVESTIVELGTVFNQLASMVEAQNETITRIDMNISETAGNVEAAHDALLSYFSSINSNRWLILKVFMILFFFFIISVIFAG